MPGRYRLGLGLVGLGLGWVDRGFFWASCLRGVFAPIRLTVDACLVRAMLLLVGGLLLVSELGQFGNDDILG